MLSLILMLAAAAILATFAWGAVRGAPWVPAHRRDLARIVAFANVRSGMRVADLGCGSGAVLAAFARAGCAVTGYELAVLPWAITWFRLRRYADARVRWGDFWRPSFGGFDRIYVFLMPATLERLTPKLTRELAPGAEVISYVFPMPGWTPIAEHRIDGEVPLYRYRIGT